MKVKRGQVLRGCTSVVCGALALGMAGCSSSGPVPDQPQDISCESLNAENARLLAARDDLSKPQLSMTDAEREAELTQLNGKLYTVAKAQFDKGCPAVANGPEGLVVR